MAGFLFGSTFLVVQGAVDRAAVVPFLAVRFLVGTAVLWPLARRRASTPNEIRHGVLAGMALLAGFLLQTTGLKTTTSATSAFLTYLLVVIVPLIGVARTRIAPPLNVLIGVLLAVAGLFLMSGGTEGIGRGEFLTVGAAFFFALHIVVLGEVSGHHDPIRLTLWQALTVAVCCFLPGFFAPGGYSFDAGVWFAAAFCGVGATAAAFWCMTWAQRVVPESQAAIILLLEPVSAAVLGALAGEALGVGGAVGAALILASVLVAELAGPGHPVAVGAEFALVHAEDDDGVVDGRAGSDQPPPS
ncbi:DMT family transporter [Aquihabitans daechungensis]|uniref:DMT family transporter n=1 Tax=Aquihabitans daechungensis TaxID=1052257 RepID=UPI003BA2E6C9